MAWQLAAPDAVDALLTLAETIPDTDVADGPKFTASASKALVIAYEEGTAGGVEHQLEGVGYSSEQEQAFTINCRAEAVIGTGTGAVSTARAAAYEALNALAALVNADPTLGIDAVMQAYITDVAYSPIQNERGYLATVRFGVTCDAWTGV